MDWKTFKSCVTPVLAGLAVFLAGCAAQDAERQYYRATAVLEQAQKSSPHAPQLKDARSEYEAGKQALHDARYDMALKNFKHSEELSEAALHPKANTAKVAPPAITLENLPPAKNEKRTLPAQALAKYLAGKRAAKTEFKSPEYGEDQKPPKRAKVLSAEVAKKIEQSVPKEEEKVAKAAPEAASSGEEELETKPLHGKKPRVILSPAKPTSQPMPDESNVAPPPAASTKAQTNEAPGSAPDVLASNKQLEEKIKQGPLRKIPGALSFFLSDPSLQPDAMSTLDQTGKFLLENPSTTLILKGQMGTGEKPNIIDARFESVKSYLLAKGVPEDQVMLDPVKIRGKDAEFEMYVREH